MATDAKSAAQDGNTFVDRRKMPDRRAGDRRENSMQRF